jgi:hypothetical protein
MPAVAHRNGNTIYVTGAGTVDATVTPGIKVHYMAATAIGGAEVFTLADVTTTTTKVIARVATNSTTQFDFNHTPMLFPNGIRITLTQADSHVTLIVEESRK